MSKRLAATLAGTAMVLVAALPLGAEQARNRASGNAAASSGGQMNPAERPVPSIIDSYTTYLRIQKMNGNFAEIEKLQSGQPIARPLSLPPGAPTGVSRTGQNVKVHNDPNGPCPRERLACKVYPDVASFEADHGTFSRVSGTFEDYELTNGPAGGLCTIDDGTKSPDVDCRQSPDTFFGVFCAIAIDAGDILTGIGQDNAGQQRGNTWWEMLTIGSGFNGATSRYVLPNYFADTHDIFFGTGVDASCGPGALPNAVKFNVISPFSDSDSLVTVTLTDGKLFQFSTGFIPTGDGLFVGLCCVGDIDKVNINQGSNEPTLGADKLGFKKSTGICDTPLAPLSLEDIACALDVIEAKLDSGGGGTGGSGPSSFR